MLAKYLIAPLLLLVLLVSGCVAYYEITRTSVGDVQSLIDDNLPRGSTTDEIFTFLDSRDIYHGPVEPTDPNLTVPELQAAGIPAGTMTIGAFMEDTSQMLFCKYNIHIEFILDEELKLKDYIVWESSVCL